MTINGKREFKFNGRKFRIQNLHRLDIEGKKKYLIMILEDGFWKPAYNKIGWELEKFETIKEAQRYVRDWDWCLETW